MDTTRDQYSRLQHYNQRTADTPHTFYSNLATWAADIGFKKETMDSWTINNKYIHDVSTNQDRDPLLEFPAMAIKIREWHRANNKQKSKTIASRLQMVAKAKRMTSRYECKDLHQASALRNNIWRGETHKTKHPQNTWVCGYIVQTEGRKNKTTN